MAKENQKNKIDKEYGEIYHEWQFSDSPQYERSLVWYIVAGALLITLSIIALVTGNHLFFFILVLFALLFYMNNKVSNNISFQITQMGLVLGKKLYEYGDINHFWIVYKVDGPKFLYFDLDKVVMSHIAVPLEDQNPVEIRKTLLQFVEEETEKEEMPLADELSRMMKL